MRDHMGELHCVAPQIGQDEAAGEGAQRGLAREGRAAVLQHLGAGGEAAGLGAPSVPSSDCTGHPTCPLCTGSPTDRDQPGRHQGYNREWG